MSQPGVKHFPLVGREHSSTPRFLFFPLVQTRTFGEHFYSSFTGLTFHSEVNKIEMYLCLRTVYLVRIPVYQESRVLSWDSKRSGKGHSMCGVLLLGSSYY